MVSKKEIITDLKKYNNALDKHFKEVDFEFTKNSFNSNLSPDEEMNSILASNIFDLKTEMAMMRRNLVSETEGMVKRLMAQQQNHFLNEIKQIYSKLSLDFKESLNKVVEEFDNSRLKLVSEFNEFKAENENFKSKIGELSNDLDKLNLIFNSIEGLNKNFNSKLEMITDNLYEKFSKIDLDLKKLNSQKITSQKSSKPKRIIPPQIKLSDNDYNVEISSDSEFSINQKIIDIDEKLRNLDSLR